MEKMHGVEITERQMPSSGRPVVHRIFSTPVGSVSMAERRKPGVGLCHFTTVGTKETKHSILDNPWMKETKHWWLP